MALTEKLTAIADAIRGKTGGTDVLTLNQMPAAIAGIQTDPILESLTITENGEYTSGEGVDGFDKVTVNVDAINALPDGISAVATGTFTVAEKTDLSIEHALGVAPRIAAVFAENETWATKYNAYTLFAWVSIVNGDSQNRIGTCTRAAGNLVVYACHGSVDENVINVQQGTSTYGALLPTQIIDDAGTTEVLNYRWYAIA